MIGIYLIKNQINNKVYVGQSRNIEQRWRTHRTRPFNPHSIDYEKPLYRSIRKYGIENFSFQVLEECSVEALNEKEVYWISQLNAMNSLFGYNLTEGGTAVAPVKLSKTECNQIVDLLLNSDKTQEDIAKIFNVSQRLISGINLGEYWIKEGIEYPIRQRQKQKKYFCIDCGAEISKSEGRCLKCANMLHRVTARPSREELKNLIRIFPFTKIGKMYGVSDNAIRKWCDSENLPRKSKEIKSYSDEEWDLI